MQKELYLCFIDYSKAFDKVRHEKLFNILEHLDIDGKDLRVIRNLYWDQSAAVRVTQVGFTGGFLIPLPSWEAKGYDTFLFRGPATSLRLPLTHSELSKETIKNQCCLEVYWELLQYYRINRRSGL